MMLCSFFLSIRHRQHDVRLNTWPIEILIVCLMKRPLDWARIAQDRPEKHKHVRGMLVALRREKRIYTGLTHTTDSYYLTLRKEGFGETRSPQKRKVIGGLAALQTS